MIKKILREVLVILIVFIISFSITLLAIKSGLINDFQDDSYPDLTGGPIKYVIACYFAIQTHG